MRRPFRNPCLVRRGRERPAVAIATEVDVFFSMQDFGLGLSNFFLDKPIAYCGFYMYWRLAGGIWHLYNVRGNGLRGGVGLGMGG